MTRELLLAIDVGNTQTVLGLYDLAVPGVSSDDGMVGDWRISTDVERTPDELASLLGGFFSIAGITLGDISGVAIASGVPRTKAAVVALSDRYLDVQPVTIGPGVKTGMPINYDNPREVGADRIANAVGAYELYGGPAIVVDFGTGNNFDIISANGEFLGGAIMPGVEISMDALAGRAAALSETELSVPKNVIGRSTAEALQSGAIYGYAGAVDGMVTRFQAELGGDAVVVATGGLAPVIAPVASSIDHVDPFLTLHGLRVIHSRNL